MMVRSTDPFPNISVTESTVVLALNEGYECPFPFTYALSLVSKGSQQCWPGVPMATHTTRTHTYNTYTRAIAYLHVSELYSKGAKVAFLSPAPTSVQMIKEMFAWLL